MDIDIIKNQFVDNFAIPNNCRFISTNVFSLPCLNYMPWLRCWHTYERFNVWKN